MLELFASAVPGCVGGSDAVHEPTGPESSFKESLMFARRALTLTIAVLLVGNTVLALPGCDAEQRAPSTTGTERDEQSGARTSTPANADEIGSKAGSAADVDAGADAEVIVFKSPTCGCCNAWVEHLRADGFVVRTEDRLDMGDVKSRLGVPREMGSCHTARVGGYVIEGHVPAADVRRLLTERPDVVGLAVPGMPAGSPGMEVGGRVDPYEVIAFSESSGFVFSRHP